MDIMARNSSVGRQLIFLEGLWSDQLVQILEHALDMTRSMIVTVGKPAANVRIHY